MYLKSEDIPVLIDKLKVFKKERFIEEEMKVYSCTYDMALFLYRIIHTYTQMQIKFDKLNGEDVITDPGLQYIIGLKVYNPITYLDIYCSIMRDEYTDDTPFISYLKRNGKWKKVKQHAKDAYYSEIAGYDATQEYVLRYRPRLIKIKSLFRKLHKLQLGNVCLGAFGFLIAVVALCGGLERFTESICYELDYTAIDAVVSENESKDILFSVNNSDNIGIIFRQQEDEYFNAEIMVSESEDKYDKVISSAELEDVNNVAYLMDIHNDELKCILKRISGEDDHSYVQDWIYIFTGNRMEE